MRMTPKSCSPNGSLRSEKSSKLFTKFKMQSTASLPSKSMPCVMMILQLVRVVRAWSFRSEIDWVVLSTSGCKPSSFYSSICSTIWSDDRRFGGSLYAQAFGHRLPRTHKITQCCEASVWTPGFTTVIQLWGKHSRVTHYGPTLCSHSLRRFWCAHSLPLCAAQWDK